MTHPITINLSGLECRGRNGWYKGHSIDVWAMPQAVYRPDPKVEIDVRGTKGVGNIIINLTPAEALELGRAVIEAASEAQ